MNVFRHWIERLSHDVSLYLSISGDPYNGCNEKLPDRWKKKQFVTQQYPKNADNGMFVKLKYHSEPYSKCSYSVKIKRHSPYISARRLNSRNKWTILKDSTSWQEEARFRKPRCEQKRWIHLLQGNSAISQRREERKQANTDASKFG